MKDRYYVGVYWGRRKEDATSCATRLRRSIEGLERIHPALGHWRKKAGTKKAAEASFIDLDRLDDMLLAGRNRRDHSGEVIEELGFRFAAWTKDGDGHMSSISCLCGANPTSAISNNFILNLPSQGQASQRLLRSETVLSLLKLLAETWDPDWGTVSSDRCLAIAAPEPGQIVLGWMAYISARKGQIPSLPIRSVPVNNGSIIVLTEEPLSIDDPMHRDRLEITRSKLGAAGLLRT